ncbi:MAG: hypothetical protein IKB70_12440 [Bacilli bacterium]|nr:hypothetical protein [Bacilli bacterium]
MAIYSYKITRDFGFAPNPFYSMCTLATCKPKIRKFANVGDWVIGFGSAAKNSPLKNKIIYIMKVEKKISFNDYWRGEEYQCKKPVMNGSLKQNYGDNIYHCENDEWIQVDSHHSLKDGTPNILNVNKDTSSNNVLISKTYWYFGKDAIDVPDELMDIIPECRDYIKVEGLDEKIDEWVKTFQSSGFIGEPNLFNGEFKRYDGKS